MICHWYVGVPPLVGVAVNVTDAPTQIEVCDAAIDTEGVTVAAVIEIGLLVAVGVVVQVAVLVITTVTISPLVRVVDVKVDAV